MKRIRFFELVGVQFGPLTRTATGAVSVGASGRGDLDIVEHENIEAATLWAFGRRTVVSDVRGLLAVDFTNRVYIIGWSQCTRTRTATADTAASWLTCT